MSGLNRVEKFVQHRNRGSQFGPQQQPGPGSASEQQLRRQAIGANARVQPPSASFHGARASAQSPRAAAAISDGHNGQNGQYQATRGARPDEIQPGERDPFDTEVDDLTESLLSEEASAQAVHEARPGRDALYRGLPGRSSHAQAPQQATEAGTAPVRAEEPARQATERQLVNGGENPWHDGDGPEDEGDGSDSSDEGPPNDEPTTTFTPEQAARVKDLRQRGAFVVERPKHVRSHEGRLDEYIAEVPSSPGRELYDVLGPSAARRNSLPRNQSAPAPVSVQEKSRSSSIEDEKGLSLTQPTRDGVMRSQSSRPVESTPVAAEGPSRTGQPPKQDRGNSIEQARAASNANGHLGQEQPASSAKPDLPSPTDSGPESHPDLKENDEEKLLDYPPPELAKMSYADLANQPYDDDPNARSNPADLSAEASVPAQLKQLLSRPTAEQQRYFNGLSAEKWEDGGHWFIEQFATMTTKMKDARREKRRVALSFEDEIARREEVVRRKTEGFEEVLTGLRKGGRGLLLGGVGEEGKGKAG